jgi:hypothetical protein
MSAEADVVTDALAKIAEFEDQDAYLKAGAEQAVQRGDNKTEADGICEFIVGVGILVRVCVELAPVCSCSHLGARSPRRQG